MGSSASTEWQPHPDGKTMKALAFTEYGHDADQVCKVVTMPVPVLNDKSSALVKVRAASLNPIDLHRMGGALKSFRPEQFYPAVLCYDAAGVIEEVGEEVKEFKVGDEVMVRIVTSRPGGCAEFLVCNGDQLSLKPANLSFEEAASLPLAGVTALQLLRRGEVKQGDRVFISGGAGGVGTLAIQLAKNVFNAAEIVTTASPGAKTELVQSLGATQVINYREKKFEDELKDMDFSFDTTGESAKMCRITKKGKQVLTINSAPTVQSLEEVGMKLNFLIKFFVNMKTNKEAIAEAEKHGVKWAFVLLQPNGKDLALLKQYCEEGKLKPVVDKVWKLDEAVEAVKYMIKGRAAGKCVITVSNNE